jgi:hypothetical protein
VHEEEVEDGQQRRNNDYILIFASDTGIHLLQEASEIFMDGTFGTVTCVPPFVQIVFLQAKVGEKRPLPAAFALLTRKVTGLKHLSRNLCFRALIFFYASGSDFG